MTGAVTGAPPQADAGRRETAAGSPIRSSSASALRPPSRTAAPALGRMARAPVAVNVAELAARSPQEVRLEAAVSQFVPPGKRLRLQLTDNRYTMISVRRRLDGYVVRAHRMFAAAEPRIVRAIARYVVHNDARASSLLGGFIERHQDVIKRQPRKPRQLVLRTAGRHHDLQAIFDKLNVERFGGRLEAKITWGPASRRNGRRKSIKMGSFAVEDRVIRIHPALDRPTVPEYFVAWIVFHEMLHGKHEVTKVGDRRCYHTKAFAAEERSFAEYERAHAWEKANIDTLLVG